MSNQAWQQHLQQRLRDLREQEYMLKHQKQQLRVGKCCTCCSVSLVTESQL